ncbi:hypothetical protein [Streptomyces sp. BH104]|uniref:hypothetical protein n=1 Tax=Streptomyces sp. BH104 TaxID=3410407 RepID=UPI003BB7740D
MTTALSEYRLAHRCVIEVKGPANHKPFCGAFAAEWAYDHMDPCETFRDGYLWSDNTAHYFPLCQKHHRAYDRAFRTHGREALPALAETLKSEAQRTPEDLAAIRALSDDAWRSREIGLGNIQPGV